MPKIYEDTRQHNGKHKQKHRWFEQHGVQLEPCALPFGDYQANGSNLSVDTKASIAEIAGNICSNDHARFRRECERARDAGYRLAVLIEDTQGRTDIREIGAWKNDRCRRCNVRPCNPLNDAVKCANPRFGFHKPPQGHRVLATMNTMHRRYDVDFYICPKRESARCICELLGVPYEE